MSPVRRHGNAICLPFFFIKKISCCCTFVPARERHTCAAAGTGRVLRRHHERRSRQALVPWPGRRPDSPALAVATLVMSIRRKLFHARTFGAPRATLARDDLRLCRRRSGLGSNAGLVVISGFEDRKASRVHVPAQGFHDLGRSQRLNLLLEFGLIRHPAIFIGVGTQ